ASLFFASLFILFFFFSSRRRHTRFSRDWSSDVCSSDLHPRRRPRLGLGPSAAIPALPDLPALPALSLDFGLPIFRVLKVMVLPLDPKSTRLNSSHVKISYAVVSLKKERTLRRDRRCGCT